MAARSVPQVVAFAAAAVGLLLFALTVASLDLPDTWASVRRLGPAVPLVLLPGALWHLLRTWGWALAFPDDARPPFTRIFRARLAADAVGFFTVRGIAGEPLKVVLLYDRVPAEVTTAAVALERLTFAVVGIAIAGGVSLLAVTRLVLPEAWDLLFVILGVVAVLVLTGVWLAVRRGSADYLGATVDTLDRLTGRRFERHRPIRFVLAAEAVLIDLVRGNRRRLLLLTMLSVLCYAVMTAEVWVVFWAIGFQLTITEALTVETFARLASVASAAVPGNIGTLEAANVMVVQALGLPGAGALAVARRVRSLLWAAAGLAIYPRVRSVAATPPYPPAGPS